MNKKQRILDALENKSALKVIAGINNFDKERVLEIAGAANQAAATCIDICAQEDIVKEVLETYPDLAIMVSSIKTSELIKAAELGADALELGNFEALHDEGIYPSAKQIISWSREIMSGVENLSERPLVSITIPGHLEVLEQVNLAEYLEALGVDIIQTEGASLVEAQSAGALGQIEKVRLTLANTVEIARTLDQTYLLTASGISPETAPLAIASGAHGVGVGKYVNKLESRLEMLAAIMALKEALGSTTKRTLSYN